MLILLAAALFATCGVSLAFRHSVDDRSTEHIEISFNKAQLGDVTHDKFWESIQNERRCCGLDGPADYRRTGRGISWSCCTTDPANGVHLSTPFGSSCASVYQRGCLDVMINTVRLLLVYSACAALAGGLVVGAGLFCVCQLSGKLKSLAKVPPVSYKQGSSGRTRTEITARRFSDVDTIDKV